MKFLLQAFFAAIFFRFFCHFFLFVANLQKRICDRLATARMTTIFEVIFRSPKVHNFCHPALDRHNLCQHSLFLVSPLGQSMSTPICFSFFAFLSPGKSVEDEVYQKAAKVFNLHCKHDLFAGKVFRTLMLIL